MNKFMINRFGVVSTINCFISVAIILVAPLYFLEINNITLLLMIVAVTLVEMLVLANLDSIIARLSSSDADASSYYSYSGIFNAVGISLAAYYHTSNFNLHFVAVVFLAILIGLMSCFFHTMIGKKC